MSFDPLSAAFNIGSSLIEKIWPDPARQAEELRKLEELRQTGDIAKLNAHVELMAGQLQINLKEAEHKSLFVAGWRPGVGWVCVVSLAMAYIPKALVITLLWTVQSTMMLFEAVDIMTFVLPPFPDLGIAELIGLLGSMLGVGIMRSVDKHNKVATQSLG